MCNEDVWAGCYGENWQSILTSDSYQHPAKFSRALIRRIYEHALAEGWLWPGSLVLDPFAGVGCGAWDSMAHGVRWLGVELEPRFVALGQQNLDYWRQRWGFTGGQIIQGDSR